jgi:hypothetical protein
MGFDLGFVALPHPRTVIGSAAMNAFACAAHATTASITSAAINLGIAVPARSSALMSVGAALHIDCHAKA